MISGHSEMNSGTIDTSSGSSSSSGSFLLRNSGNFITNAQSGRISLGTGESRESSGDIDISTGSSSQQAVSSSIFIKGGHGLFQAGSIELLSGLAFENHSKLKFSKYYRKIIR